jgi:hypothetical protein
MVQVKQANLATPEQADRIAEVIADKAPDLTEYSAWDKLDALSSNTEIEAVEVLENQVFIEDNDFAGNCVVYVQLNYGQGRDMTGMTANFPGRFRGHFEDFDDDNNNVIIVDDIEVDTSSFYE